MSKKKYSTSSINTGFQDTEIVSSETIEVAEEKEVVSEKVIQKEQEEITSQEIKPSEKTQKIKAKVVAMNAMQIALELEDQTRKVISRPDYSVKLGDIIEI